MKIALVTGGQPRFTTDFVMLMNQLTGFEQADFYMTLWTTDWAINEVEARQKIEKTLLPNYKLAKVQIVDEPPTVYPPHDVPLVPPREQNVAWWYRRLYVQSLVLAWANDLIDQKYDAVVRFRLDGCLDRVLDLSSLDLSANQLILPARGKLINDQFAVGTQEFMKLYFDFGKQIPELVPLSDPLWAKHPEVLDALNWHWGREELLEFYMNRLAIPFTCGNFSANINNYGRSRFTDKHYHHPIAPDPTL
jgi:hypothetical protein